MDKRKRRRGQDIKPFVMKSYETLIKAAGFSVSEIEEIVAVIAPDEMPPTVKKGKSDQEVPSTPSGEEEPAVNYYPVASSSQATNQRRSSLSQVPCTNQLQDFTKDNNVQENRSLQGFSEDHLQEIDATNQKKHELERAEEQIKESNGSSHDEVQLECKKDEYHGEKEEISKFPIVFYVSCSFQLRTLMLDTSEE
jgi:hypothetical protein